MLDYRQLHAFAAVLDCGSFDRAAQQLHLTQSAVSQRVKLLEEYLGQALIVRSQPIHPTPAGQKLLRHYRQVSLLQGELMEALSDGQGAFTRLAIGLNADSLATWFVAALAPLLQTGNLLVDLRVEDQDQTHHFLRSGEVMGCISASDQPMQGCRSVPLGVMHYRALATPAYRQRYFSAGCDRGAFQQAPMVEFNHKDELQGRYLQQFFGITGVDLPRHRVPSPEAYLNLIRRGLAWGMLPDQQSAPLLQQGVLEELVADQPISVALHWHRWNLDTDISARLTRALVDHCREALSPMP